MRAKIIVTMILLLFVSCQKDMVKRRINVVYLNGDTENIIVKYNVLEPNSGIFFSGGCIYLQHYETQYDNPYKNCVICGVRKFKILKHK